MLIFCVGHVLPVFEVDFEYVLLSPRKLREKNNIVIPDNFGVHKGKRVLSEYQQLFVLADMLAEKSASERLYIFQYRRFISTCKDAPASENMPYLRYCRSDEVKNYFPKIDALESQPADFLFGEVINLKSIADNYAKVHFVEDFCGLISALSQIESVSNAFIKRFIECPILLPGPSVGLTTVGEFRRQMHFLKLVWAKFQDAFFVERTGYQKRNGGFLMERLHSFLIVDAINRKAIVNWSQGVQMLCSEKATVAPDPFPLGEN